MNKGIIKIHPDMLNDIFNNVNLTKAFFSNFYPIYIDDKIDFNHYLTYYGYSEHFDEVDESGEVPEYNIWLINDENGVTKFNKFEKVLNNK